MTTPTSTIEFWFDFASPYSYLAASRVGELAYATGVELAWRPFLLGPIFTERGWSTSPFVIYADKGRYMWRDVEREAAELRLPFARPPQFPANTVLAARVALIGVDEGWIERFARAVFEAHFVRGLDPAREEVIDAALASIGRDLDPAAVRARATAPEQKAKLRAQVDRAKAKGVFGAPTFVVGDELFWGNDRLERALAYAAR